MTKWRLASIEQNGLVSYVLFVFFMYHSTWLRFSREAIEDAEWRPKFDFPFALRGIFDSSKIHMKMKRIKSIISE